MRLPGLLLPIAVLVLGGCVAELADVVSLQRELMKEHPGAEVMVNLDQSHLRVAIRNSAAGDADEPEQLAVARRVGQLVLEQYPAASRLESISVAFGRSEGYGAIRHSRDERAYSFSPAELAASPEIEELEEVDDPEAVGPAAVS